MKYRKRPLLLALLFASILALPQLGLAQQAEQENIPTRGLGVGLLIHSFGYGFDVQYYLLRDNGKTITISTSISSYKHPRELKQESAYADQGGKDYIWGKRNYGYVLAPTVGIGKDWIGRNDFNKINLRTTFSAGPVLALLKPYYLEVAIPIGGNQAFVDIDRFDPAVYNYTNIVGEADYFIGVNEITVTPGIQGRVSTMVDFAGYRDVIRGIEVSVFGNYFTQPLDLMDLTQNRQFWVGGSIEFIIGNTW